MKGMRILKTSCDHWLISVKSLSLLNKGDLRCLSQTTWFHWQESMRHYLWGVMHLRGYSQPSSGTATHQPHISRSFVIRTSNETLIRRDSTMRCKIYLWGRCVKNDSGLISEVVRCISCDCGWDPALIFQSGGVLRCRWLDVSWLVPSFETASWGSVRV